MDANNLKLIWQKAGGAGKSESEIKRMTNIINHPSLKKIRTKLLIESISLTFFLFIYYDWFDGNNKTFTMNVLLVSSLILYILNDVIGYFSISRPIRGANLKISIEKYYLRIKRFSVFSLITSFLYGLFIILYFSSTINFNKEKYLILIGIVIILLVMTYLSFQLWNKWIASLKIRVNEFMSDDINSSSF